VPCVDLHLVEHADRLPEHVAIQFAARAISCDQIAGTIDDARVQLRMLEDYRTKEVYRELAEGLVSWEQVGTVEVAEDPVQVFLQLVSISSHSDK
jgi:hypothetical protein